jgi:UDP-N-acetylglucosamine acyltransferase
MSTTIHPTAIVDPRAQLGEGVVVGPYAVIESDVQVGDGCEIGPHVLVAGGTRMGRRCRIFKGASIGTDPQDLRYNREPTFLWIGDETVIREFCTINRGTVATGETRIGSNGYLMAYCHVAHDCHVGHHFTAANTLNLAGHVTIGDHVGAGGTVGVVQFRTVGDYAFLGAYSLVIHDVVPFALVTPEPTARVVDINKVGLERRGFDEARRRAIKDAYKILFRQDLSLGDATAKLAAGFPGSPDVQQIIAFAKASKYGLLRP